MVSKRSHRVDVFGGKPPVYHQQDLDQVNATVIQIGTLTISDEVVDCQHAGIVEVRQRITRRSEAAIMSSNFRSHVSRTGEGTEHKRRELCNNMAFIGRGNR